MRTAEALRHTGRVKLCLAAPATQYAPGRFGQSLIRLADNAVRAAFADGWDARLLGLDDRPSDEWRAALDWSDAVVLLGGHDVDPDLYGGRADYPGAGDHLPRADKQSLALIDECRTHRRPLLGICRGLQLINVAYGGTLVEHLDNHLTHALADDEDGMLAHEVVMVPGTMLAAIMGERAVVQSSHHQGIDRLGEGLVAAASASHDGLIEAVEDPSGPLLGVQWHPEDDSADPDELPALLGWLRAAGSPPAGGRAAEPRPPRP